ncbi:MAG: MjaI family restriction endonuclease [Ignavibacteria bacterium]|nr:MjaI family restriction endonuclease [Ignavibacteria bacterium]
MKFKIKNDELQIDMTGNKPEFPKYTTQVINLANQNAQGTRPNIVGQMSDLIQEFQGKTFLEWKEWYLKRMPDAIDNATDRIFDMVIKMKSAGEKIDREMVKTWVEDLVFNKTFIGLKYQSSILKRVALKKCCQYRLATPEEEGQGIDGFIGDLPVSIKPETYKTKNMLNEDIEVGIIFYDKKKDGITVTYEF